MRVIRISRSVGIPIFNGERYIDMFDRSHDGIHMIWGDRNSRLYVAMFEDIIVAMDAIECRVPDLRVLLQGAGGEAASIGDGAHLIRDARDILDDAFGVEPAVAADREPLPLPLSLSDDQAAVVAAVEAGFTTAASVAEHCGGAAEVAA